MLATVPEVKAAACLPEEQHGSDRLHLAWATVLLGVSSASASERRALDQVSLNRNTHDKGHVEAGYQTRDQKLTAT